MILEPALVLESNLSVAEALGALDRYSNFSQVVVRMDLSGREPDWFAMPAHRLRWLLQDAARDDTLEDALDLRETIPSPVRRTESPPDSQPFEGVLLEGDQVIAVATVDAAAVGEAHRAYRPAAMSPSAAPSPSPPPAPLGPEPDQETVIVPVLFATDRAASGQTSPAKFYGAGRGPLSYGVAEVSIPAGHERGELEAPVWWRFEFRPDPKKHVTLVRITPNDRADFVTRAREVVGQSSRREVLVFLHGYNVSFENAARRTAQIVYDLQFQGAPMLYSWPSAGGTLHYLEDETNARWTVPHFNEFLTMIQTELDATAIHVIAHSMGNRVLTEALRTHRVPADAARLRQVVLAAPDIDADTFADLAREFPAQAERVTLYASSRDLALKASKLVHGHPRAGDTEPALVITAGIDTVDASGVDTNLLGHSYVGDASSILADVHTLLESGQSPLERRFHLEPREQAGQRYWRFRP